MKLQDLTKQQKQIGIAIIALIVLIIAVAFSQASRGPASPATDMTAQETATSTPTSTPEEAQPAAKPKIPSQGTIDQDLAHAKALEQYEGRVIQFNPSCQATPAKVTFKNGTAVMFD